MSFINKLNEINSFLSSKNNIEFRIINNTLGKNLILLDGNESQNIKIELEQNFENWIYEIIIKNKKNQEDFIIKEIENICDKNSFIHRNISYINWNRESSIKKINNVIAGYSFKGGMGRSTTLAYLAYFYYLMGKKVVVLDCDFEAPGIASMFFKKNVREEKAGILDYLIDLNVEKEPKLDDYFLQNEVSTNSGNLYLFPSGIDYDIDNYINKISKIDFNSKNYTDNFSKLLNNIKTILKPDLIFIDLRAGINESNGFILKNISNINLLFFNSEEQNEDGLKVILNSLKNIKNNFIINSTIRFAIEKKELIEFKKNEFKNFVNKTNHKKDNLEILQLPFKESMLETNIKEFGNSQYNLYKSNNEFYLQNMINIISNQYFNIDKLEIVKNKNISNTNLEDILKKVEKVFSTLTGTEKFKDNDDLKYFYLKDDISKIVNEQIFLILGAKGSGKSTLYEVFTKQHRDILNKLNIKNNSYIDGFSKSTMSDISEDYISKIFSNSNKKPINIKRFWKCLTLFQLESKLDIEDRYFQNLNEISDKFIDIDIGLEVDKKLKNINIDLLRDEKIITLVYDELDIGFTEESIKIFISELVSFWQDNIYKYSQIKSKILLRNDIFNNLNIENKTHLELNKYELKWNKKEILSIILKIFVSTLEEEELDKINLLNILKNKKNREVIEDIEQIKEAIYLIFDKRTAKNRPLMDEWIMTRLADSQELITPRVIYKFMSESIKKELKENPTNSKTILISSFKKHWENILTEVSKHKLDEYNAEFKGNDKIYEKIKKIGQRTFSYEELKRTYSTKTSHETIKTNLKKLQDSGFISYDDKNKKYQVAYIYVYGLELKINRSKSKK